MKSIRLNGCFNKFKVKRKLVTKQSDLKLLEMRLKIIFLVNTKL
jgi:hypothetical protein